MRDGGAITPMNQRRGPNAPIQREGLSRRRTYGEHGQTEAVNKDTVNRDAVNKDGAGQVVKVDLVTQDSVSRETGAPTDAELVVRVQNGSKADFQLLVERYQQRAFAVAFQILKRHEDAQDVVQEAFVKAYLSIDSFQGTSSFFTWFYRIVVNMAIDFRRKMGRKDRETISIDVDERDAIEQTIASGAANQPENPLDNALRSEQARQINKVLGEISEDHRAVIVLREVEGLRYEQIADVLGISKGTVMSRLHYARKKLQQLLTSVWGVEEKLEAKSIMNNSKNLSFNG